MNTRDRFLATMHFRPTDAVPNWEMGWWDATLRRWHGEGLPTDVHPQQYFGLDRFQGLFSSDRYVILGMVPEFDEVTLEEDDRYRVWISHKGVKLKELRTAHETSMPQWLDFPVKNREDFHRLITERYNSSSPARYPPWWEDQVRCWQGRDYPLAIASGRDLGFFGTLREMMGPEALLYAFHDDPAFIHEAFEFFADFAVRVMSRALKDVRFDFALFFEDMAYKTASLISPDMFRRFMLAPYRKVTDFLRGCGVDLIFVDSDGNINELVPLFLEAGVNGILPLEIQAGMDPGILRKKYGKDLLMMGGIDKKALARGRDAIETELASKLTALLPEGGYLPHVDHSIPPDISYDNFCHYLEAKKKLLRR